MEIAAHAADLPGLRRLIEAGADPNERFPDGRTPLHVLSYQVAAECVEFLLSQGADPKACDQYARTPLHEICFVSNYGHCEVEHDEPYARFIRALVRAGASVEATDRNGCTPMHDAALGDGGNSAAIRALLTLGARPDPSDSEGQTPLMLAASRGELECVELLLAAGADPNGCDAEGVSAVDLARDYLASCESMRERSESTHFAPHAIQRARSTLNLLLRKRTR